MDDEAAERFGRLEPSEFKARLDRGEAVAVLDVREDHERAYAAIPLGGNAIDLHIPLNQIPMRLGEIVAARADAPLVVYCHHGVRSAAAADWLARQGIGDVANLEGGIDAWSRRVDRAVRRY